MMLVRRPSFAALAAILFTVLLSLALLGGAAQAQIISNTAEASWSFEGEDRNIISNEVSIEVEPSPTSIRTFRPVGEGGSSISYSSPRCGNSGQTSRAAGGTATGNVTESNNIHSGQDLFFQIDAPAANRDSNAVDELKVVLTTSAGDREELIVYETGPDTGVFVGMIPTRRVPPAPIQGDCSLSAADGEEIAIEVYRPGFPSLIVKTEVEFLVDPFGVVFDSETGEPVSGATITLIDTATGQPARVFAEDGVTSWPSTIISGQPITDGAGNVYQMEPGEYWFPLTAVGRYRLEITPPSPYTAPSVVSPEQLAMITRPDGRAFVIQDGSYGNAFNLSDPTPVQIDIPLDRPSLEVSLTKSASRDSAQPGDAVFYTVTATNPDARIKRNVVLVDSPSRSLRLRTDSIRINGTPDPDAVTASADGSSLTIRLGDIPAGETRRVTYAMVVRADAPPGQAVNRAETTDSLGRVTVASTSIDVQRDSITGRMTIIGRVTAGGCSPGAARFGIPGVRVMMEDGSFVITDIDGRYHFEGVVPGTHVVQVSKMTLPEGGRFVDCHRSTRNAGSATSRFAIGQGGALVVADFHADLPEAQLEMLLSERTGEVNRTDQEDGTSTQPVARKDTDAENAGEGSATEAVAGKETSISESGSQTDWIALGDGPDGWLTPEADANPRVPAIRVAIRHRKGQKVNLMVDGEPANSLSFDGVLKPKEGRFAVSTWRGVPLTKERTVLTAEIINSFGEVSKTLQREVHFTTTPAKVEFVPEQSKLIADGRTNPVIAIRVLDRNNRPLREGISGEFKLNAPYQSAAQIENQRLNQLTGFGDSSANWVVRGDKGIALIELAPTMVSGSLRLDFRFNDGEIEREQELEAWIKPGDIEWTVIGLAEGTTGARSVADNMERAGRFDSDLGDDARVALFAKGRVLGKFLLTLAYDSAKQADDQRLLGTLDPDAYYTVYGDGSSRRFDAASREKLYIRIETATFYALYGDFESGFDQTKLAHYNRVATGVKAEGRFGDFHAQGFAAEISTHFRRDEIQGEGITGPYSLSSRAIVANSDTVSIETRDRFRSEIIISRRELTRFLDYDIDLLSGTITFKQPVLSRDFDLNPQFIIVEYETETQGNGELNAGVRADWTDPSGKVRVGATAITDKSDGPRTNLGAVDIRARIGNNTEVRAELGVSRKDGENATGWLVEAQHSTGSLDVLAYARSLDADYGFGQQSGAELGRRKFGVDARARINEQLSITGSLWQDDSLTSDVRRRAAQTYLTYTSKNTTGRIGLSHFNDRLNDGTRNKSTVLEGGVSQRLFNNKLELSVGSSIALDDTQSVDLPARHRLGARYAVTNDIRLVGTYEIAKGDNIDTRTISGGFEVTPWRGSSIVATLGDQQIHEFGSRSYAAFGLAQTFQVTPELAIDATIDGSRTLGGTPPTSDIVNPAHPVASGGQIGQNGTLFEDFTAVTMGAAWRKDRWSATARGEYRDGEFANRKGFTFGAIRQLGEGSIVGSGLTWTEAKGTDGSSTEILDAAIAFAYRPDSTPFAALGKIEYRSDAVQNATAGETGPAGRTALRVDGDAVSRRLLASLSTNWSPYGVSEVDGAYRLVRRNEFNLFLAGRYNFDRFEGYDLGSVTALVGADGRIGISDRFEIGATGNIRANLDDNVWSYSFGPYLGFVPTDDVLLTIGYNITGFRDPDFSATRNTDKGIYASIRFKIDADTFDFLNLNR